MCFSNVLAGFSKIQATVLEFVWEVFKVAMKISNRVGNFVLQKPVGHGSKVENISMDT